VRRRTWLIVREVAYKDAPVTIEHWPRFRAISRNHLRVSGAKIFCITESLVTTGSEL
jgi:hypothetical protein